MQRRETFSRHSTRRESHAATFPLTVWASTGASRIPRSTSSTSEDVDVEYFQQILLDLFPGGSLASSLEDGLLVLGSR